MIRNAIRGLPRAALAAAAGLLLAGAVALYPASAHSQEAICAAADARLAATGKGDSDYDGLSNCSEKKVTGTNARDFDTDNDTVADGDEVTEGSDPVDDDSDDDGSSDGEEDDDGTDPTDSDSDGDGEPDGSDDDPVDSLENKIEGAVDALECDGAASVTVLGIAIAIDGGTEFEGADSCADLETRIAANGSAHVEVEVEGTLGSFTAEEIDLEDSDDDGSPDDVDDDDDNDGEDDEDDEDDDDDGEDDEDDDDDDDD